MKASADCIALIKSFESCKLTTYVCPAGIRTIGYGHTGDDVHDDMAITPEQAKDLLLHDLERFERAVNNAVTAPLLQNQFDALVAFAFNVGAGAMADSTMVRLINQGHPLEAAEQFPKWNKGGGKVITGLVRRRAAERLLFLGDESWRSML